MIAICSSSTSQTKICFCTPICGAARAMPESLSYKVSNMSSTRRAILPLISVTSAALVFNTGSPYVRILYAITARLPTEMGHYFDEDPDTPSSPRDVELWLPDMTLTLTTDRGVFGYDQIDAGSKLLLLKAPPPPPAGSLLDLGCGVGTIALPLARRSPAATVWAVDVNSRARDLCAANAVANGVSNVRV